MLISVIIPTIGRDSLGRAVQSALDQGLAHDQFEVIVVNDSGRPLRHEDWQKHPQVSIVSTYGKERSIARNAGAALSRGRFLNFLDDDDYLLPGALIELLDIAEKRRAHIVYGTARLLNQDGDLLTNHHIQVEGNIFVHVMSGEWIPLSAAILSSEAFFKVGGFDARVTVVEDKDLYRKVAVLYEFAQTEMPITAVMRNRSDTTTNYSIATFKSIESRNYILRDPRAFRRMRLSADTPYWRGRMLRAYLTCVVWNFQKKFRAQALINLAKSFAAVLISFTDLMKPAFWKAAFKAHTRKNVF